MRSLIDMRFGHGTWAGIINERARRIREAKEAEEQAKKEKMKKKLEFEQMVETSVTAFLALGFMVIALLSVIYFATRG